MNAAATARRLGQFSLGLGLAEAVAPRALARALGVRERPLLTRTAYGLREIAVGVGLLTTGAPSWVWARVAGDVFDLATLAAALGAPKAKRGRIVLAAAGVAAVTALDVRTALALGRRPGLEDGASSWKGATAPGVPAGARRIVGSVRVERPPDEVYRAWRDPLTVARMVEPYLEVDAQSPDLARLRVRGPAGAVARWSWDVPEERAPTGAAAGFMRFRTLEGATVRSDGTARLRPADGGRATDLEVEARFETPLGAAADAVWTLAGRVPQAALEDVLERFKRLVESGEAPTSSGAVREADGPEPVLPVDAPSGPVEPPPAERR